MTEQSRLVQMTADFAAQCGVRLLYAVEGGSRSWGFASQDSDFDVRFVYAKPLDAYLRIGDGKRTEQYDSMQRGALNGLDVDLVGWDISKFLSLLQKTNPSVLEWVRSPYVYFDADNWATRFLELAIEYYSPIPHINHYFNMARENAQSFLQGDEVNRKKYLYVARPILCARWIIEHRGTGIPPLGIDDLLAEVTLDDAVRSEYADLLAQKRAGVELLVGPRFHALHQFIDHELATMRTQINEFQTEWLRTAPSSGKSSTHLNEVFLSIIKAE